jgi:hypothetical protein
MLGLNLKLSLREMKFCEDRQDNSFYGLEGAIKARDFPF